MLRTQLLLDRFAYGTLAVIFGIPGLIAFLVQLRSVYGGNGGFICAGLLGFVALILTGRLLWSLKWPERHWIGKCLRQIDPNPWELARAIDAEWRAEGAVVEGTVPQVKAWWRPDVWFTVLMPNWLIHVSRGRIVILMPDKISWLYRKITADTRTFARTRFHYAVSCRMSDGVAEFDVSARTELIALWLASELVRRKPQVLTGYQGDWIELSRTNPAMLSWRTEQRRWEYEALPRPEQALWIEESIEDLDEYPRRVDPYAPETMK